MTYDVAVVGAGAAGLTAALRAAEGGASVILLNAQPRIGLKILMSGGTRCNVTHRAVDARDYNGGSRPFVARILRAFPPEATRAWFESMGVALKLEPTGKYFPTTDRADTVLDALLAAVGHAGVTIASGARVVRLERGSRGFRLAIQTMVGSTGFADTVHSYARAGWPLPEVAPERWIESTTVILATGGLSFPKTGSDGTGYALAVALGHTVVPPMPALTPLVADDPLCREAQGLTLDVELSLSVDRASAFTTRGSFLFTHFGYSGPAALDLSRHWLRAGFDAERIVRMNVVPGANAESLLREWLDVARTEPRRTVRRHLGEVLPDRLALLLARESDVDPSTPIAQVTRERRTSLLAHITARELPVTGTLGFEKAEVTAGGILLSEVDPSTLESRVASGVFLCGEILDVDGRLGGFNFQWSWSSGTVAGRASTRGPSPTR